MLMPLSSVLALSSVGELRLVDFIYASLLTAFSPQDRTRLDDVVVYYNIPYSKEQLVLVAVLKGGDYDNVSINLSTTSPTKATMI